MDFDEFKSSFLVNQVIWLEIDDHFMYLCLIENWLLLRQRCQKTKFYDVVSLEALIIKLMEDNYNTNSSS